MTEIVKMALKECGRTIAESLGEDCTKVLDLSHEEILEELALGMMATLKDDSPAIYEIFLKRNNTRVKLGALEKIHNENFLKKNIFGEYVHSDAVKMKIIGKIEDKKFLKELLKEKAIYERSVYLYKLSERFEDKDLYEIITSDSYNIRARLFFVSKIKDKKYLEKIIKESKASELIYEAMFCLNYLE